MTYRCYVLVSSWQHQSEVHAHERQIPLCLEWGAPVPREFLWWWQFLGAFLLYCGPHAPAWTPVGTKQPCCCSLYETKSIEMMQPGILLRYCISDMVVTILVTMIEDGTAWENTHIIIKKAVKLSKARFSFLKFFLFFTFHLLTSVQITGGSVNMFLQSWHSLFKAPG